jgi:hypothetical protein
LLGSEFEILSEKYLMRLFILLFFVFAAHAAPTKLVQGRDSQGKVRACHPMAPDEFICTQEFTEGDQFAIDCIAKGGEAIACGCHDYLCILVTE